MNPTATIVGALVAALACGCAPDRGATAAPAQPEEDTVMFHAIDAATSQRIFETPVATLAGETASLSTFQGKALLVVNVASECGLTPQYAGLEKLQQEFGARGFTVVGFPCNQFGGQEPGTPEQIQAFCSDNYGVTFPLFEKIDVNGAARHPIYGALTRIPDAEGEAGDVQWNFEKFVIAADGKRVARFRPRTEPQDRRVVAAIEAALPSP